MENNSENRLMSIEEIQKLASEQLNILPDFNLNVDEILKNINELNVVENNNNQDVTDLIRLYTGEYVENNLDEYFLLDSTYYPESTYAKWSETIEDYYENTILITDAIEYVTDWEAYIEGFTYFKHKNDLALSNYNKILLENRVVYINKYIKLPVGYKLNNDGVYYLEEPSLKDLPYYDNLVENLDLFYPNQWEFKKTSDFKFNSAFISREISFVLLIHFPKIQITNSKSNVHTIEDLYVALPFDNTGYKGGIYGTRTKVSDLEFHDRYLHSHLGSSDSLGRFSRFCTGTGEINLCMSNLMTEYSDIRFKALLAMIKPYVEWESLEGTPYKRIDNVARKVNVDSSHYINFDKRKVISIICESIDKLKIHINSENMFDINFQNVEDILDNSTYLLDQPKIYKNPETLDYYKLNDIERVENYVSQEAFIFKGNIIYTSIFKKEVTKENLIVKPHPYVTESTRRFLSERINEYYFKKRSS